jgi:hypothetical protein
VYSLRSFVKLAFGCRRLAEALTTWRDRVKELGVYADMVDGSVHRQGSDSSHCNLQLILYLDGNSIVFGALIEVGVSANVFSHNNTVYILRALPSEYPPWWRCRNHFWWNLALLHQQVSLSSHCYCSNLSRFMSNRASNTYLRLSGTIG